MPSPSLHLQLKALAQRLNLTPYGISQAIAAETDPTTPERKRIEKRWQRILNEENFRVQDIESDLKALGYSLKIEKN